MLSGRHRTQVGRQPRLTVFTDSSLVLLLLLLSLLCRCFDLVPHVLPLPLYCNLSSEVCSENCSLALREVHMRVGCCFNTMFNMSRDNLYPFAHTEFWDRCEQPPPGGGCTWCSHADSLDMTSMGLMLFLVASGPYMIL